MSEPEAPRLLDSAALRRAALARSALRGAQVARRRLAWRWTLHGLRLALTWLTLPALVLVLAWAWRQGWRP
jgi:hypothetical protein